MLRVGDRWAVYCAEDASDYLGYVGVSRLREPEEAVYEQWPDPPAGGRFVCSSRKEAVVFRVTPAGGLQQRVARARHPSPETA